jgi:hypothetical protein
MQEIGKIVMFLGALALAAGAILYMGWGPVFFGWMGRLPGDIRIEKENARFYFPIVTCVVLSIILTLVIRLVIWIRGS